MADLSQLAKSGKALRDRWLCTVSVVYTRRAQCRLLAVRVSWLEVVKTSNPGLCNFVVCLSVAVIRLQF